MTKNNEKYSPADEVQAAVQAAYDPEAASDCWRLSMFMADDAPSGEAMVYAVSEEPRYDWLTIVAKPACKPPVKVVVSGRGALVALREAIDRMLAYEHRPTRSVEGAVP